MPITYESLASSEHETRILEILSDPPGSMVRCRLQTTSLLNPSRYSALSYCWGSELIDLGNIIVDGIELPVTRNLLDALITLRMLGVTHIWVDALCINQADKQEKSLQIRAMTAIYANAEMTYAWLGRGDENETEKAICFLQSLIATGADSSSPINTHTCRSDQRYFRLGPAQSHTGPDYCQCCQLENHFTSLWDLFERPYWRRYWIIQEVSATVDLCIMYGKATISLNHMSLALTQCRNLDNWSSQIGKKDWWFNTVMSFRRLYLGSRRPTLLMAMYLSQGFMASEPRDAIYALLGLTSDGAALIPIPNYFQSKERLMADMTRAIVRHTHRLDVLDYSQGVVEDMAHQSSWAKDWLGQKPLPTHFNAFDGGFELKDDMSLGHAEALQVTGLFIGKISATTVSIDEIDRALEIIESPEPILAARWASVRSGRSYYNRRLLEIRKQLTACLVDFPHRNSQDRVGHGPSLIEETDSLPRFFAEGLRLGVLYWSLAWRAFCQLYIWQDTSSGNSHGRLWRDTEADQPDSKCLQHWCRVNRHFQINGFSLQECVREQHHCLTQAMKCASWLRRAYGSQDHEFMGLYLTVMIILLLCVIFFFAFIILFSGQVEIIGIDVRSFISYSFPRALQIAAISQVLLQTPILLTIGIFEYGRHFWRLSCTKDGAEISASINAFLSSGQRLAAIEKNVLCNVPHEARIGDEIFHLAGKANAIVLRRLGQEQHGRARYSVVGTAFAAFNDRDERYYKGFWNRYEESRGGGIFRKSHHVDHDVVNQELLEKYKRDENWRTIDLM